jgi:predicted nuclease of predicted toxin-antitoxin system
LLDANLSPRTASFLSVTFGFDVVALLDMGLGHLDDDQVVAMAKREQRVVITLCSASLTNRRIRSTGRLVVSLLIR